MSTIRQYFFKYHGAGNDFVLIDNRSKTFDPSDFDRIAFLCNRHLGIGADGLMLLCEKPGYDFEMLYYNADGRPGSLCGNGGRCIVAFAHLLGLTNHKTSFWASDGPHRAEIKPNSTISLELSPVSQIQALGANAYYINTGSPHYVEFVGEETDLDKFDVWENGRAIRNSAAYLEKGVNVNFVKWTGLGLQVRTYERGVEDETLSCGTGVTAAALVSHFSGNIPSSLKKAQHNASTGAPINPTNQQAHHFTIPLHTKGGSLQVSFTASGHPSHQTLGTGPSTAALPNTTPIQSPGNQTTSAQPLYTNIWLSGPATLVFKGEL